MKIENISNSEFRSLIIMFILGTSLLVSGDSHAMQDTWISIIIAVIVTIPLVFIYGKLVLLSPGMGLFDILPKIYGKFLGKLFIFIYTFYFFHLGAICIRNTTEYIQVVSFPETPQYVAAILLGLLSLYAVKAGLSVLDLWTKLILPLIVIMITTTFTLGFPQFNISYIRPVLYNGWGPVIKSGYSLLTFPFGEIVVFMVFFNSLKDKKNTTKVYITSVIIGGILLLIVAIRNILLLGFPNLLNIYFPSHYAASLIHLNGFVQRIEILISIGLLFTSFVKISVLLYVSYIGVVKLFNLKNYKYLSFILCILMIILSMFLYKNTMEMLSFINLYKYYVIPFQFIIPILTLIVASIRKSNIRNI